MCEKVSCVEQNLSCAHIFICMALAVSPLNSQTSQGLWLQCTVVSEGYCVRVPLHLICPLGVRLAISSNQIWRTFSRKQTQSWAHLGCPGHQSDWLNPHIELNLVSILSTRSWEAETHSEWTGNQVCGETNLLLTEGIWFLSEHLLALSHPPLSHDFHRAIQLHNVL